MSNVHEKVPILFLVFNRPDKTYQVFQSIRQYKPTKLYIAGDGPRKDITGEDKKVTEVQSICAQIDWKCDCRRLFRKDNLGCKIAVSEGIDWFFKNETSGIILEDDCLPSETFFTFCGELLERYADDERIMHISGNNYLFGKYTIQKSYYFSNIPLAWGWATWRRAWNKIDFKMEDWNEIKKDDWLNQVLYYKDFVKSSAAILDETFNNNINTWDYQWIYTCWKNNGLTILPSSNLVINIGFDDTATHTNKKSRLSKLMHSTIIFPLKHPNIFLPDRKLDYFMYRYSFENRKRDRILKKIRTVMSRVKSFIK